jgi:biotin carboxyl carrier protein
VKRYRVTVDGQAYDIEVDDPRARPVTARLLGTAYTVDIQGGSSPKDDATEPPPSSVPSTSAVASAASAAMTAPIPGVVCKVVVKPGQTVSRGDELLTIEAMKMFNVMRSPRQGTIASVDVKDGDHVVQGQLLVTFAP